MSPTIRATRRFLGFPIFTNDRAQFSVNYRNQKLDAGPRPAGGSCEQALEIACCSSSVNEFETHFQTSERFRGALYNRRLAGAFQDASRERGVGF
jgi:hypothetical protein